MLTFRVTTIKKLIRHGETDTESISVQESKAEPFFTVEFIKYEYVTKNSICYL